MVKTGEECESLSIVKEKYWNFRQYYIGDKDEEDRKNGKGENHWSGVKSLEWYEGRLVRDTMHGVGNYYWRFLGPENTFMTYEGLFYCNQIHGYGTMSYSDGRTFHGLFLNNLRWGPGIESHVDLCDDVGLWRGLQLLRLVWCPAALNITPDFMSINTGRVIVESHRVLLTSKVKTINEVNTAIELLKQCGSDPHVAVVRWNKLFSKYCTDVASPICHVDFWDQVYYNGKINTLQEKEKFPDCENKRNHQMDNEENETYYAWNNNKIIIDMMKHTFRHEQQRNSSILDLKSVLSGPRSHFKRAGVHELECRTMLMACYLGYIADVARLVNENNINPNICDGQGNCAIMYAVCGDQLEIIHFLVDAGADVDMCNDTCCTALAVALMRYTCAVNDVASHSMLQAMLPPLAIPASPSVEQNILDWNIIRDQSSPSTGGTLTKSPSKTARNMSSKKIKSFISLRDHPLYKRKTDPLQLKTSYPDDEPFSDQMKLYNEISLEYCTKVTDTFVNFNGTNAIPYLFHVYDLVKEIENNEEDQKKQFEKIPKKVTSKLMKEIVKPSKDALWETKDKQMQLLDECQKRKLDVLLKIMLSILELLSVGAKPKSVRCPQPALFIAISSNSPPLMRHLIHYGADVNEIYKHLLNYTPLDLVICRPFTYDNFEMARVLLENGADACHRLECKHEANDHIPIDVIIPGPTLLHNVLSRKTDNEKEEDIRRDLLDLLLEYNCSSTAQFKGRSAIDVAMNKNMELLHIFIKNSKTDLNAIINDANQNILVKIFNINYFRSMSCVERLQTITNLLLYGADPLLKCQDGNDIYENVFVFAKQNLIDMEITHLKPISPPKPQTGKQDSKGKKPDKSKKDEYLSTKSTGKMSVDEVEDYKQAVELMSDCARSIFTRRLQAKLIKELVVVIGRFRHRHWNMILKELNDNKKCLWLTPQRCLEIWDILYTTKNKIYNDKRILRHLLCIVIFISWKSYDYRNESNHTLTASIKNAIESDVIRLLKQYNERQKITFSCDVEPSKLRYVRPELDKEVIKYNVCFECIQPLSENKILCCWCNLVSFCSNECIKNSINRENSHPCNDYLRIMFNSSQEIATSSAGKS